jgi:hypothetical protein
VPPARRRHRPGGRRDRYARFGWEKAGNDQRVSITAGSAGTAPDGWKIETFGADQPVPDVLWAVREAHPVRALCDRVAWDRRRQRGTTEAWLVRAPAQTSAT